MIGRNGMRSDGTKREDTPFYFEALEKELIPVLRDDGRDELVFMLDNDSIEISNTSLKLLAEKG